MSPGNPFTPDSKEILSENNRGTGEKEKMGVGGRIEEGRERGGG